MDDSDCRSVIAKDLLRLGVKRGGVLLVHSSFKSLGPVPGGIETLIGGLRDSLGPDGTLLMPALSWVSVDRDHPQFDVKTTPSCVGAVPEYFRGMPETLRSMHPTHSVCGQGPKAGALFQDHILDRTPCGINSPFHKLRHYDGQVLMLGCVLLRNTSMHAVEEAAGVPYVLDERPLEYTLTGYDGEIVRAVHRRHARFAQNYDRIRPLLLGKGLAEGSVLNAGCHLMDAGALWERALAMLNEDPYFFARE